MAIKSIACAAIPLLMAAMPTQAITVEQLNNQVKQLNKRISNEDQRFRINGFASFTASQSDEELSYANVSEEINFRQLTKAGIQMTFNLDEKTSVITQLVSRGSGDSNFNTQMDWGYLRHNLGNGLTAKFGRFRGPYYLLSEYLDVSYAVPWTSMPAETYAILGDFANMEGADLTWDTNIGDFGSQVQVVYGRVDAERFYADDLFSLGYTLSGDTWSVRAAHSRSSIVLTEPGLVGLAAIYGNDKGVQGTFNAIGLRWEPGDFLVISEITSSEAPGIIADQDSYYMTVGYRIGQWMPHVTIAHVETTDDDDRTIQTLVNGDLSLINTTVPGSTATYGQTAFGAGIANNTDVDRIGLGVRYDFSPGVAMKLQYDIIDTNDSRGQFLNDDSEYTNIAGAALGGGPSAPDSVNILTFSIDTVF